MAEWAFFMTSPACCSCCSARDQASPAHGWVAQFSGPARVLRTLACRDCFCSHDGCSANPGRRSPPAGDYGRRSAMAAVQPAGGVRTVAGTTSLFFF
ncbi:hypothetical protein TIFTF001_039236 [Ficus carica]|uniref:Uncharacterized protein n=1 Tax=Ficus carica TaxID=3494 RepID=A0AA88JDQ6_FICCA|nr:hypothetical protein TIFTF001_039234 [Ficus carica]GMN70192.1 hypothetical protein TIFTF001_039236 [Ficus carica]